MDKYLSIILFSSFVFIIIVSNVFSRQLRTDEKILSEDNNGYLFIYLSSSNKLEKINAPAIFYLVNPDGLKTGIDQKSGLKLNEIPNSAITSSGINDDVNPAPYGEVPMTDVIEIIHPSTGNYNLFILGTGTGEYDLEFVIYDHEGRRSYKIVKSVKITKDDIHKYHFEYNDDLSRQLKVDFSQIPESARER